MLIGYVSDERDQALADVACEFLDDRGRSFEARSRAGGSVHADLTPGPYTLVLQRAGFGARRARVTVSPDSRPLRFRLLADGLLGYAWPKCVRAGDPAEARVHSTEAYSLDLWRYGREKELVQRLGWFDDHGPRATVQITPDGDYTRTGVEWNRVGYPPGVQRPELKAPERSGLYYLHAATAGGRTFTFPWVVAPARPRHPVAVLASDLTWNAYNAFGGRSNYINAEGLPAQPTVHTRQDLRRYADAEHATWGGGPYPPLSFERPDPLQHVPPGDRATDPMEGRLASALAPADWRLLAWLEREGFGYDYYSDTQLHRGLLDLSAYRVLVLGPHPEYWTRAMYDRVKWWVFHEGGRLMYLGGNGLNCEVELHGDTMVVHNGKVPDLAAAKLGGESRFALRHESEASLLGVVFTPDGAMTAAPYRVIDDEHWAFAGTGLRKGDSFGAESLHRRCPGGASGHETDKRSPSSPKNAQLLAKGLNGEWGGAEMVCFDAPGGGAVFSAGSICYIGALLVDPGVSRVTSNVLRRFLDRPA